MQLLLQVYRAFIGQCLTWSKRDRFVLQKKIKDNDQDVFTMQFTLSPNDSWRVWQINCETDRRQAVPMKRPFARSNREEAGRGKVDKYHSKKKINEWWEPQRGLAGSIRWLNAHIMAPIPNIQPALKQAKTKQTSKQKSQVVSFLKQQDSFTSQTNNQTKKYSLDHLTTRQAVHPSVSNCFSLCGL